MLNRWSDVERSIAMMDQMRRRIDRLWDEFEAVEPTAATTGSWPRLNLADHGNALMLMAEVPGLAEKDIKLTVNQDVLTLEGERTSEPPQGYTAHRQERARTRFSRSFALPTKVDVERATASVRHGILTVTLPKAPEAQPRQIAVRVQS